MNSSPFFQGGQHFRSGNSAMSIAGLTCELNMPKALLSVGHAASEMSHRLPPYNRRAAFLVDDYPAAPPEWLRSSGNTASYMVPVEPEHGAWLDFNGCRQHEHDVAIVVSVQGVNAITGLKSDVVRLEQYRERCPKHKVPFTANRRCAECGFDWPEQNYIATTGAPQGYLWIDGFRLPDGTVRQFVFTEDVARGVAKAIIGAERCHAIGVAFFLSKEKPVRAREESIHEMLAYSCGEGTLRKAGFSGSVTARGISMSATPSRGVSVASQRSFEVAAGAKISQRIHRDPQELSYWQDEPAGILVINYTDAETMLAVLAGGSSAKREGFLEVAGLPVGHK